MKCLKVLLLLVFASIVVLAVWVYLGRFPVGADVPHSRPVYWLMQTARDRAIAVQSRGIRVPDLSDPKMILEGAGQYAAMCSTCHLAPGYARDETWAGLYPQPPKLYQARHLDPAKVFWVLKHGLKMSGMPAWGPTHEDGELWAITAFVMQLPKMSAAQYQAIVARAPMDPDMTMMPMPGGSAAPAPASSSAPAQHD